MDIKKITTVEELHKYGKEWIDEAYRKLNECDMFGPIDDIKDDELRDSAILLKEYIMDSFANMKSMPKPENQYDIDVYMMSMIHAKMMELYLACPEKFDILAAMVTSTFVSFFKICNLESSLVDSTEDDEVINGRGEELVRECCGYNKRTIH